MQDASVQSRALATRVSSRGYLASADLPLDHTRLGLSPRTSDFASQQNGGGGSSGIRTRVSALRGRYRRLWWRGLTGRVPPAVATVC